MRKVLVAVALTAVYVTACKVHMVDPAQPIAIADKFYAALKDGDTNSAKGYFSPEFRSTIRNWPKFIDDLQQGHGRVSSAELQTASLASNEAGPCYLLTYTVQRGSLPSREKLFLCSKLGTTAWFIAGHEIARSDTGQSVAAGTIPRMVGVNVP